MKNPSAGLASVLFFSAALSAQDPGTPPPSPPPLALTHVTVVDVIGGQSRPDVTVVVSNRRVTAMGPANTVRIPRGAQEVDARGKFLIPGLWDMHLHSFTDSGSEWMYPLLLSHGVTGVRELGTRVEPERIAERRREILEGRYLGPRYGASTGRILDGPNSQIGPSVVVETAEQARALVGETRRQGLDFVKVYNNLSRDVYLAVIDEARRLKIPVAGHVPFSMSASEVSDLGQVSIEHFTDLLVSCSRDEARLRQERLQLFAAGGPVGPAGPIETRAAASYDPVKARALCERSLKQD